MPRPFRGEIKLDVRDSTPDWDASSRAGPPRAPNVLVVLHDDTGCAAWSPYGGRINMPTMQPAAGRQWPDGFPVAHHRAVLADPLDVSDRPQPSSERVCVDLGGLDRVPSYSSHIPPENGTLAHVLRDAGWSTFWVGKDHNVPIDAFSMGASKKERPLGLGYDRFYGFIGGETNQWYPDLAETTTTSTSRMAPKTATTCPRTSRTRRWPTSVTPSSRSRTSPGTCGSALGRIMPPTMRPRTTSTGTRAASTTAMSLPGVGCCPG
jgi:Sulfatase